MGRRHDELLADKGAATKLCSCIVGLRFHQKSDLKGIVSWPRVHASDDPGLGKRPQVHFGSAFRRQGYLQILFENPEPHVVRHPVCRVVSSQTRRSQEKARTPHDDQQKGSMDRLVHFSTSDWIQSFGVSTVDAESTPDCARASSTTCESTNPISFDRGSTRPKQARYNPLIDPWPGHRREQPAPDLGESQPETSRPGRRPRRPTLRRLRAPRRRIRPLRAQRPVPGGDRVPGDREVLGGAGAGRVRRGAPNRPETRFSALIARSSEHDIQPAAIPSVQRSWVIPRLECAVGRQSG